MHARRSGRPVQDRRQLHAVPQQPDDAGGRGRFDRAQLARVDDGQLRARSVLAGGRPTRDDRSPERRRRHRGRVFDLPHADGPQRRRTRTAARARCSRICRSASTTSPTTLLAHDGVSCTLCHQISSEKLGTPESFVGGFVVAGRQPSPRPIFGPFEVEKGLTTVMRSSAEFQPTQGDAHPAVGAVRHVPHAHHEGARTRRARSIGELPEQVLYQEWQHSAFATRTAELPVVSHAGGRAADADHVGARRAARGIRAAHVRRRQLLHAADAQPVSASISASRRCRRSSTRRRARTIAEPPVADGDRVGRARGDGGGPARRRRRRPEPDRPQAADRRIRRAGPGCTSPSAIATARSVFESGAITPSGLIQGNDNDADADEVRAALHGDPPARSGADLRVGHGRPGGRADDGAADGRPVSQGQPAAAARLRQERPPTRTCRSSARPRGCRLRGRRRSRALLGRCRRRHGPFQVDVELRFQPIAFRWAQNLKPYDAPETEALRRLLRVDGVRARPKCSRAQLRQAADLRVLRGSRFRVETAEAAVGRRALDSRPLARPPICLPHLDWHEQIEERLPTGS